MAQDVRLNCYSVKLKNKSLSTRKNGDILTSFDNFFTADETKLIDFSDFFREYIESFDEKFYVQSRAGKAISLVPTKVKFASEKRLIYGSIEGGDTEIGGKLKKVDDTSDDNFVAITKDHVHAIEYFFLLWLPNNCNVGLLIVQAMSDKSVSETFRTHYMKFVNDIAPNFSLKIEKLIPEEIVKQMEEEGEIKAITLTNNNIPVESAEKLLNNIKFEEKGRVKIQIKISQLERWTRDIKSKINLFKQEKNTVFVTEEIHRELGMDETTDYSIEFERNGKKATAKMSKNFELTPYIYVEDKQIKRDVETNLPLMESVESYVLNDFFPLIKSIVLDL